MQTNEVGRSAALLAGLTQIAHDTGLPVRLLEIGASAGLNLLVDRFAHPLPDGRVLGAPGSAVHLGGSFLGRPLPPAGPEIIERRGCDPAPVDPCSTEGRLTLTSYVWADQRDRLERLRAALTVAAAHPVPVERSGAGAFLERELGSSRPGVVTVVWHSVVRQYLSPHERDRVDAALAAAGRQASVRAPLAHLALEPTAPAGGAHGSFALTLTSWPRGRTRVLADCGGHGPPIVWH